MHAGIVLLEDMLSKGEAEGNESPPNKRRKIKKESKSIKNEMNDGLTHNERIYSQLSRLYQILGYEDTVLVLSKEFSKLQLTQDGIQAYLACDYRYAYDCYQKAEELGESNNNRNNVSLLEKNIWKEEKLKCLKKLSQWDQIYTQTSNAIGGNIDNVWNFGKFVQIDVLPEQS